MATLAEWLRTMLPSQTNQCGRSRNYGNESTIKKLVLFVVSRSVVASTIQKPAGFPSERYSSRQEGILFHFAKCGPPLLFGTM
jgi:hypothetical protein